MKGKTFYTVHLYHCICSRMCVRRLHRAFPAFSLVKHTVQSSADGWHMRPEFPTCTMTQIFTLCFHRALPSTAALLTRALRFNYRPVSTLKPHLLSRTGNCLSQCKGGNWIAGLLGKMYTHCSCAYLIMLWIVGRLHNSELEAYPSWVILYKRSDRESRFGTHWDCFNQEVKNGFQSLRKKSKHRKIYIWLFRFRSPLSLFLLLPSVSVSLPSCKSGESGSTPTAVTLLPLTQQLSDSLK